MVFFHLLFRLYAKRYQIRIKSRYSILARTGVMQTRGNTGEVSVLFRCRYYHGVIELCAFKQYIAILRYLISLNLEDLPVWKRLVDMAASPIDSDALAATTTLKIMLEKPNNRTINSNWKRAHENKFAETISRMIGSEICNDAKVTIISSSLCVLYSTLL